MRRVGAQMGMMKQAIQEIARRCGYTISRNRPRANVEHINVLDLVIQEYMRSNLDICVLQIGANDGQRADPIHDYISRYRWKGVLVEPQPRAYEVLTQTYAQHSQVVLENCAIAHSDGETQFYTVADSVPFRWTGLAQLSREKLSRALAAQGFDEVESLVKRITVPALSLSSLIKKHSLSRIDLLQIDTEGFDYEIIKMIDFARMAPSVIHFEHACVPLDQHVECWEYLSSRGYRLAFVRGDTIAWRAESGSAGSRQQEMENS
jgi:FkbM family methyltransferase